MISLSSGLRNSLIVLEHLRTGEELNEVDVSVGTFTNCRECGLTFTVFKENSLESFTFCIYEHRNSDGIIINGKEGFISMSGDLPYKADSKHDYLASFSYNEHYQCADKLKELILEFANSKKKVAK